MPMILPYQTRQMLWLGLQQPGTYFSAFDKFISGNQELAGQWEENTGMANLYREAFTWLGNEMAIIYTVSDHHDNDNVFAVLKVSGGQDPGKGLSHISDRAYSGTINGHSVNTLKESARLKEKMAEECVPSTE